MICPSCDEPAGPDYGEPLLIDLLVCASCAALLRDVGDRLEFLDEAQMRQIPETLRMSVLTRIGARRMYIQAKHRK